MNFPYSKSKWLALSVAAVMMASAGSTWAAESASTTPATTTAAPTQPASLAPANAPEELTLDKAVQQALATNSTLKSTRLDVDTADTNARLVDAKVGDISSEFIASLDAAKQKYVTQAQAEAAKKVNAQFLKATESKIKLGAEKAFYDLLNAQADLELKKQSLKRAETQLKVAQSAFNVGTRAKTELLQAEAGLAGAQAAVASSESNLLVARMKLNQFLGVDLNKEWVLKNQDKEPAGPSVKLEDAVAQALQKRAEIVQKQEEINVQQLNVDLIAKYSSLGTYQGMMAKNDLEKAKLALEDTKRSITVEVTQAYYQLVAAKSGLDALKKAKDAAAENYRLTNLRFENGLATTLEVIGAEEDLSKAENNYQQMLHDYNLAVVSLENAMGN